METKTIYLKKFVSSLEGLDAPKIERGRLVQSGEISLSGQDPGNVLDEASVLISYKGPGDNLDFVKQDVLRTVPGQTTKGSGKANNFEPNYFPYVEFKSPNTPWSRSLGLSAGDEDDDIPFMALIVLSEKEKEEVKLIRNKEGELLLELDAKFIPSQAIIKQSAHIQVVGPEEELRNAKRLKYLAENPENVKSRVFCARKLDPQTNYTAYLISIYRASVKTLDSPDGLNDNFILSLRRTSNTSENEAPTTCRVLLDPWSFTTGEDGDFESLARKLKLFPIDKDDFLAVATAPVLLPSGKTIDKSDAFQKHDAYEFFRREAALVPLGDLENDPVSEQRAEEAYKKAIKGQYGSNEDLENHLLSYLKEETRQEDGPFLGLPLYGRNFTNDPVTALTKGHAEKIEWLQELNFNPKHRVAAGLGVKIVKDKQEDWVLKCWRQAGEIKAVNQYLRNNQSGLEFSSRLWQDEIVENAESMLPYLNSARYFPTLAKDDEFQECLSEIKGLAYSGLASRTGAVAATIEQLKEDKESREDLKKNQYAEGVKFGDVFSRPKPEGDKEVEAPFTFPINFFPNRVKYVPSKEEEVPEKKCKKEAEEIISKIDLTEQRLQIVNAFIKLPDSLGPLSNLDPVLIKPVITDPVYACLKELSLSYIFPGYNTLPDDRVTLLQENTAFIESLMVGANHELNNELAFREYPFLRSSTPLTQFWESVVKSVEERRPDVMNIHTWNKNLGKNRPGGPDGSPTASRLVFAIKSELLRRYPGTILYLTRIKPPVVSSDIFRERREDAFFESLDEKEGANKQFPIFTAKLTEGCYLYGFDLTVDDLGAVGEEVFHFCIQQRVDTPKYGLDLPPTGNSGNATVGASDDWSWPVNLDNGYLRQIGPDEGMNAAAVAKATYQKPIRVVMPVTPFLQSEISD